MTATVPTFNPFDPSMVDDPYPVYAQFRADQPVQKVSMMGLDTFVFAKYDDVSACLRNHEVFSSQGMAMGGDGSTRSLIGTDPPDHTKLRRMVSKPFQPSAIAAMEPWIRDVTNELVDEMIDANRSGGADLVEQLSYPLPMTVIAEMLGIPAERRADFKRWSEHAMGSTGPTLMVAGPPMNDEFISGPAGEMRAFFAEVVEERRRQPGDDLISMLVNGNEALTSEEILMFCVLLLIAGNETTTNLVSNAALALFAFPEEAEALSTDLSLVPSAMEESLRFDSPVQFMIRQTTTDVTVKGHDIPAGSGALVLFGSANRDADKYPDPDRFDVRRDPRDHVAFGAGIHLCLGAALARLESKVVFEVLLGRTKNLRPAGPGERSTNPLLRGMRHLPVTFDAA